MLVLACAFACSFSVTQVPPIISDADLAYLRELAVDVLDASRVAPGAKVGDIGPNTSGATLIRPGGRNAYPAFWIRDYAMSLDAGVVRRDEQRHALFLTAAHQPDVEVKLPTGSVLPPGSIPDHISFGGVPIYFPGILEDYDKQGSEQWGFYPSLDDHFFFVHMAYRYGKDGGDWAFLKEMVKGKSLLARLEAAYAMPSSREDTDLVYTTQDKRGINFGFFDTTVHTGDLLFASILKHRASRELAEMLNATGDLARAARYRDAASRIANAIPKVFATSSGFLRASTGVSAQPDVWGTAFAVYLGVLDGETEKAACNALAKALANGTIAWKGAIRHVPTDQDFSRATAWEKSYAPKNRYQNGAYWPTPTGWVAYVAAKADLDTARGLIADYIAALREDDFRKGLEHGAPWECRHQEKDHRQNPVYLTSVTAPLAALERMLGEQGEKAKCDN